MKNNQHNYRCLEHPDKQLLMICLQKKCQSKRKCCVYCVDQYHSKHLVISTEKFLLQLQGELQKCNKNKDKQKIRLLLEKMRIKFVSVFQQLKSQFLSTLSSCQSTIQSYLNNLHQLLTVNNHETIKQSIYNTFDPQHYSDLLINQYIQLSKKAQKFQIGTFQQTKYQINQEFMRFEDFAYFITQQMNQQISKLNNFAKNIQLTGKTQSQNNYFNPATKANGFNISDSNKQIMLASPNTNNYGICCLQRKMDNLNNRFYVKIKKNLTKRIWFGVCIMDVVRKFNFMNLNGHGKGLYALDQGSNNGYSYNNPSNYATTWNHHSLGHNNNTLNNSSSIGWTFAQGDIIKVQINYHDIYFYLINQDQNLDQQQHQMYKYEWVMPIQLDQGDIYPFVGLNGAIGDQVQILSKNEIKLLYQKYGQQEHPLNLHQDDQEPYQDIN